MPVYFQVTEAKITIDFARFSANRDISFIVWAPGFVTLAQQKAGRTITARITGGVILLQKTESAAALAIMGVSPPMSSVVVEKHHPVTVVESAFDNVFVTEPFS